MREIWSSARSMLCSAHARSRLPRRAQSQKSRRPTPLVFSTPASRKPIAAFGHPLLFLPFEGGRAGGGKLGTGHYPWLKHLTIAAQKPQAPGSAEASPGPPPYFYTTTIRPDAERPYAKVLVVAMDMRQLELDMEAGVEDPKPLTGARGSGKIPRDPKILSRVVGAFNGAFKTTHGEYGMMVHRRVLLPPKPNAATVLIVSRSPGGPGHLGSICRYPE